MKGAGVSHCRQSVSENFANYGPVYRLDIEFLFDGFTQKPIVLAGANGSGMSSFLSQIGTGLLSAQAVAYHGQVLRWTSDECTKSEATDFINNGFSQELLSSRFDFEPGLHIGEMVVFWQLKQDYQTAPED